MTEAEIGPAMVGVMCQTLRSMGYEVLRQGDVTPKVEVTVFNLERMAADEYRADVEAHIRGVGKVLVRRVYAQLVTSDGATRWMLKWPRRHKEGTPFGRDQEWILTAAMSGLLSTTVLSAVERAIGDIVAS